MIELSGWTARDRMPMGAIGSRGFSRQSTISAPVVWAGRVLVRPSEGAFDRRLVFAKDPPSLFGFLQPAVSEVLTYLFTY
jgi:hypothetical protein